MNEFETYIHKLIRSGQISSDMGVALNARYNLETQDILNCPLAQRMLELTARMFEQPSRIPDTLDLLQCFVLTNN
jgi:hypothetical protein